MPTEQTLLLAALFVALAAAGWAFAYFGWGGSDEPPPPPVNADYLRGLNLVLNQQTDEALELFVRMAKVNDETLETHFALGHLFRRRGEIDRAIRVHQNLLARPNLNEAQRHQALFSLAKDYLSAGLFDRAEKLFADLRGSSTLAEEALASLVDIYERESDWHKAIEAHRALEMLTGEKSTEVAHYYCELAEKARLNGDLDAARQYLKNSVRSETGAFRGKLIRAAIAQEDRDHAQAIRLYEQVLETDSRLMADILPELVTCYRDAGRERELESRLRGLMTDGPGMREAIAYAVIRNGLVEPPVLTECVEQFIESHEILAQLVNAEQYSVLPGSERAAAMKRVVDALRRIAQSGVRYRCTICGYGSQRLVWHCPSCKAWESLRPVQALQLDQLVA